MLEELAYGVRIALLFSLAYWVLRVSGKKTISAMTTVDLMGVFLIAAMAAEPLVSSSAVKTGLGIGIVVLLQLVYGLLSLWNSLGSYVQQQPSVLIRQGRVDRGALLRSQLSLEHLLSELRLKGHNTVADVEYAVLEPSGEVSVIPRAEARPLRPADLGLPVPREGLALPLVLDGAVIRPNLRYAGLTEEWLGRELAARGYRSPADVLLAEWNSHQHLTVQGQAEQPGAMFPPGPGPDHT